MSEQVRLTRDGRGLFLRDSFIIVFYCKKPFGDLASAFGQAFGHWLEVTPEEGRKWASVGANSDSYKPLTPQRLAAARRELDPAKALSRELSTFDLGGPESINPDHFFTCLGFREAVGQKVSYLEVRLPRAPETDAEIQAARALAKHLGSLVPYSSGYASPALTWGVESQQAWYSLEAGKLAFRHPGYDVPNSANTCYDLGEKLRGAYWLNFIGPAALEALGGEKKLRATLDASIGIEQVGHGLMLQAGPKPEVGDVNRQENLPLLRSLAKTLEPVCLFTGNSLENNFIEQGDSERWLRRHLD